MLACGRYRLDRIFDTTRPSLRQFERNGGQYPRKTVVSLHKSCFHDLRPLVQCADPGQQGGSYTAREEVAHVGVPALAGIRAKNRLKAGLQRHVSNRGQ